MQKNTKLPKRLAKEHLGRTDEHVEELKRLRKSHETLKKNQFQQPGKPITKVFNNLRKLKKAYEQLRKTEGKLRTATGKLWKAKEKLRANEK